MIIDPKQGVKHTPDEGPPDFELADLEGINPETVIPRTGTDSAASFFLTLALIYNDMKGLLWWHTQADKHRRPNGEISPVAGQLRGFTIQIKRLAVGLLHELFETFEEFRDVVLSSDVKGLLESLPEDIQGYWNDLVNLSNVRKGTTASGFARVIESIRNRSAFHYRDRKALVRGFRKHFYESPPSPYNEHAYVSLGPNLEGSRFYYADAAAVSVIGEIAQDLGEGNWEEQVQDALRKVNFALAYLVNAYLKKKQ